METRLHARPKAALTPSFTPVRGRVLQRKCACGGTPGPSGECENCRKKRKPTTLQRTVDHRSSLSSRRSDVPTIVHEVLHSPGQSLDASTRAFMEPRFGHDFSRVRVHADAKAAESAREVNALAYTVGGRVVFGEGHYAPGTETGQRLLAHELTHVIQQSGLDGKPQISTKVSEPSDTPERQAERVATDILADHQPSNSVVHHSPGYSASPAMLCRKERPWPINGYVINNSKKAVIVWNDTRKLYTVAAGATSARFTEDVDHIRDKNGQWYKIGPNTVTVGSDGKISGYQCAVSNYGEDCSARTAASPSLSPVSTYGVTPVPNK